MSLIYFSCNPNEPEENNTSETNTSPQNYFKIQSVNYNLSGAYYIVDSADGYTALVFTTPGLTHYGESLSFSGQGNMIGFDISDVSPTLIAGNYFNPEGFYSGITLNYQENISGTDYEIDQNIPGSLNIVKNGAVYNVQFQYSLTNGQEVVGQYVGSIIGL